MSEKKFQHGRDQKKDAGIKAQALRTRLRKLSGLSEEEKETLGFIKTLALVLYKHPHGQHAWLHNKHLDIQYENAVTRHGYEVEQVKLRNLTRKKRPLPDPLPPKPPAYIDKPLPQIEFTYRMGELSQGLLDEAENTLKNNQLWKPEDINNILQWQNYLQKYDIDHTINFERKKIEIEPASLSRFLEQNEDSIKALAAKEEARKESDPTGDSTDSYLLASIRSIRNECLKNAGTVVMR